MLEFERHVGIDWSGAGLDGARNRGLAVADASGIVSPPRHTTWSRDEVEAYLIELLRPGSPRTLVAIDAALSYPDGFQHAVFGVESWSEMVTELGRLRRVHPTARQMARAINDRFETGGPFRFNDSRNVGAFYREHHVAYFRAVELLMPQCISPFYLGSGASVGFHAITCLSMLARLIDLRRAGEVSFAVWPQEGAPAGEHVIAECYPSMYPADVTPSLNPHQRDAARVVGWLLAEERSGRLTEHLRVGEALVGRRSGRSWSEQLAFEGWVLGV